MKKSIFVAMALGAAVHAGKVRIVSSLTDEGSIASWVGGDRVEVSAIARPTSNPHSVEILPSHMLQVGQAAIYLRSGLGLDGWSRSVIEGSRNARLKVVDCSQGVAVLEKPEGKVDASRGDVHAEGNPHWWLDPRNAIVASRTIEAALEEVDPAGTSLYRANQKSFETEIVSKMVVWKAALAPFAGKGVVGYHGSWSYFAAAFGLGVAGTLEPLPGIPPTARHLADVCQKLSNGGARVILVEPYFREKDAKFVSERTAVPWIKAAPSCAGVGRADYAGHLDELVADVRGAKP